MLKLYTDAATRGNPGPTGLGALIIYEQNQIQLKDNLAMATTNHEGEFDAAIMGFKYLMEHFAATETILFYTDSRLVSDALGKNHSKKFTAQLQTLTEYLDYFALVVTRWVPEKQNQGAHQLANQALRALEDK
ncbi:ribonuclease HI family protein [Paucilactobacillus wasatchensis]|uniref:RNase H n=1 Tax=Paucilactobacillus wasatchensis TaxID=1335616 RepID=A0A0D1A863_9LACO|nr:ribonuclease HI family protein [Paucilactobacillus wasatchensis]KIS04020.1 RNase H [Paucilactobacillus wasatchensis]